MMIYAHTSVDEAQRARRGGRPLAQRTSPPSQPSRRSPAVWSPRIDSSLPVPGMALWRKPEAGRACHTCPRSTVSRFPGARQRPGGRMVHRVRADRAAIRAPDKERGAGGLRARPDQRRGDQAARGCPLSAGSS